MQVAEVNLTMPDAVFGFFHDLLVTENYYVLLENPMRMDLWKLLTKYVPGNACIAECLYMDMNRPMKVCRCPRMGMTGKRNATLLCCSCNWLLSVLLDFVGRTGLRCFAVPHSRPVRLRGV